MQIGSTMRRTCAPPATGNMEGIKMLGTAFTKIDFFIQWECVKHAILVIITK
jgi:hypothetical protein